MGRSNPEASSVHCRGAGKATPAMEVVEAAPWHRSGIDGK